jgi:hypothetical protein
VGARPFIISPIRIDKHDPRKMLVGPADAAHLRKLRTTSDLLSQGRIIIVTDLSSNII